MPTVTRSSRARRLRPTTEDTDAFGRHRRQVPSVPDGLVRRGRRWLRHPFVRGTGLLHSLDDSNTPCERKREMNRKGGWRH